MRGFHVTVLLLLLHRKKVAAASGTFAFNTSLATIRSTLARAGAQATVGFILRSVNSGFAPEVSFAVLPQPLEFGGGSAKLLGRAQFAAAKHEERLLLTLLWSPYFTVRVQ